MGDDCGGDRSGGVFYVGAVVVAGIGDDVAVITNDVAGGVVALIT